MIGKFIYFKNSMEISEQSWQNIMKGRLINNSEKDGYIAFH